MSLLDASKNLVKPLVSGGHNAAATTVLLQPGEGGQVPQPSSVGPFNMTWWDQTSFPDPSDDPNVEIVRVTARVTDTLTVIRAQEGTAASNKNTAGHEYVMVLAPTAKLTTDINQELVLNEGGFYTGTGTGAAYNLTVPLTLSALSNGMRVRFAAPTTNSAGVTFNLNGLGASAIKKQNGINLEAGDVPSGAIVELVWTFATSTWILLAAGLPAQRQYASLRLTDNATATVIAAINTPVIADGAYTAPQLSGFTHNGTGTLTYTGLVTKIFKVGYSAAVQSAVAPSRLISCYVAKGGVAQTQSKNEDLFTGAAGDSEAISGEILVSLAPGNTLAFFLENNTAVSNITARQLSLVVTEAS